MWSGKENPHPGPGPTRYWILVNLNKAWLFLSFSKGWFGHDQITRLTNGTWEALFSWLLGRFFFIIRKDRLIEGNTPLLWWIQSFSKTCQGLLQPAHKTWQEWGGGAMTFCQWKSSMMSSNGWINIGSIFSLDCVFSETVKPILSRLLWVESSVNCTRHLTVFFPSTEHPWWQHSLHSHQLLGQTLHLSPSEDKVWSPRLPLVDAFLQSLNFILLGGAPAPPLHWPQSLWFIKY